MGLSLAHHHHHHHHHHVLYFMLAERSKTMYTVQKKIHFCFSFVTLRKSNQFE